jgi:oxygen-independent coproporphyrinogen-3 oxidase
MLLMGLRLHEGVEIERWLGAQDAVDVAKVDLLEQDGLLRRSPSHVALTPAGRPLLNAILREIIK